MTNKIRIAIVGAGLSGLSCAWHLLQNPDCQVTLYDPAGIGGGASGMAAGLLHRYAGRFARANWMGLEGYDASLVLLKASSQALGRAVYEPTGFLRAALTDENLKFYKECAEKHDDVDWLSAEQTGQLVPGITVAPAILIKSALMVHGESYLQGLWLACQQHGAHLQKQKIETLEALSDYDKVIITTGAHIREMRLTATLPVTPVKGQLLQLEWPQGVAHLPLPISNQVYIVMAPDNKSCIAGSTFEHDFVSELPDLEVAMAEILPRVEALYPLLANAKILGCRAGVRASTPGHKPLLKKIKDNCWVLVGMGSKGLLYHGLFGKLAADEVRSASTD